MRTFSYFSLHVYEALPGNSRRAIFSNTDLTAFVRGSGFTTTIPTFTTLRLAIGGGSFCAVPVETNGALDILFSPPDECSAKLNTNTAKAVDDGASVFHRLPSTRPSFLPLHRPYPRHNPRSC
mmetsp:Transcript_8527/g.16441  ORF Transcript_8527/g.16441 Transcript_8527/m.16441 type:complete len:123 (-) Transcript_8527:1353-1721(-)